jgi:hypothetical protein
MSCGNEQRETLELGTLPRALFTTPTRPTTSTRALLLGIAGAGALLPRSRDTRSGSRARAPIETASATDPGDRAIKPPASLLIRREPRHRRVERNASDVWSLKSI